MLKITSKLNAFIKLTMLFLIIGISFAAPISIVFMLAVLLIILIAFFLEQPRDIEIARNKTRDMVHTDNVVDIEVKIRINDGVGLVQVVDMLPNEFELVSGNNIKLIWKFFSKVEVSLIYSVKPLSTGHYPLNRFSFETYHFMDLKTPLTGILTDRQIIEVRPKLLEIKKIRDVSTKSKIPLPAGAVTKMGIPTLDFRELRLYNHGDSFKYINWKATARNTSNHSGVPIVNEYEKEGKKTVWLFLDLSSIMRYGVNIKNAFQCALEAVNGLTDYYLKQNCLVAFCTFNGSKIFIYPGAGQKQYHRILKGILQLRTREKEGDINAENIPKPSSLRETVVKHKNYFHGNNPLCIIVSRLTKVNNEKLSSGIREMLKYTSTSKKLFSVMVVNISGYNLAAVSLAERTAAEILKKRDQYYAAQIKKRIIWIDWDPTVCSFTTALLKQVVKR